MINTSKRPMRIFIASLVLFFFILSCEEAIVYDFRAITIQTEDFEECSDEQCPTLFLDYFELLTPKSLAETVNLTIQKQLIAQLVIDGQQPETIHQTIHNRTNNN